MNLYSDYKWNLTHRNSIVLSFFSKDSLVANYLDVFLSSNRTKKFFIKESKQIILILSMLEELEIKELHKLSHHKTNPLFGV